MTYVNKQTMQRTVWGLLTLLAALSAGVATFAVRDVVAAVACAAGRSPVTLYAGVNPTVQNLPPRMNLPGAATADLNQVILQWLPTDPAERVTSAENITINYLTETQENVDLYNGETKVTTPNIAAAELLPSNFTTGQLTTTFCAPDGQDNGLLFAIYGTTTKNVGFQTVPFKVKNTSEGRVATTVTNEGAADQVGIEFNLTGADQILNNISIATNTPTEDIPRVVAENIYQETIPLQFGPELERMNLMNNPQDGIVHSNYFIVTGDNAEASVPGGVTAVYDGDTNIYNNGRILGLDNRINATERVGALSMRVKGYHDRTVTILEGRTKQNSSATTCTTTSRIRSNFTRDSTLEGTITLYKNGTEVKTVTDNLDKTVNCDNSTYTITAERHLEGINIPQTTQSYTLGTQPKITGLDMLADGTIDLFDADGNNVLDATRNIGCANPVAESDQPIIDPTGSYTWIIGSNPSWMGINGNTGLITLDPSCGDTKKTYSISIQASGTQGVSAWFTIDYKLL